MSIKLNLTGFNDLLTEIQKADGNVNSATAKCIKAGAEIMQSELTSKMRSVNVDQDLISRMPSPEIEQNANKYTARVGFKKGAYDPTNPSDGYKAVFINYGTPRRTQHGQVKARGFIQAAKKAARSKIKAEQEKTLDEILKGLKK